MCWKTVLDTMVHRPKRAVLQLLIRTRSRFTHQGFQLIFQSNMSKSVKKTEVTSVKDAMKEYYAAEKMRRATSKSPGSGDSGKLINSNKNVSPSSVVTPIKSTPKNDLDTANNFGSQISMFFGVGSSSDAQSAASSNDSGVSNTEDFQSEIVYLKKEVSSLQELLEDSMGTLMTLNDKLQSEKANSTLLQHRAEEAESQVEDFTALTRRQDLQLVAMQREIERLTRAVERSSPSSSRPVMTVSDDDEEDAVKSAQKADADVKGTAVSRMDRVAHNDRRLAEVRQQLVVSMRSLSEQLVDDVVSCDQEFDFMADRNPLFRALAKPPVEPEGSEDPMDRKMFSPKNTSQPEGFLFGVPSARFKVLHNAIKESSDDEDEENDEESDCVEHCIDHGAEEEEYSSDCGADDTLLSALEFGY